MKQFLLFTTRLALINFIIFSLVVGVLSYAQSENKKTLVSVPTSVPAQNSSGGSANPSSSSNGSSSAPTQVPAGDIFSLAAPHNIRGDCWIVYQGHVYDITSFFGSHPGGDAIMLKYCGKDANTAFDTKDKFPPNPHSGEARSLLQQFLVK